MAKPVSDLLAAAGEVGGLLLAALLATWFALDGDAVPLHARGGVLHNELDADLFGA